jgi:hypothetical protein
MPQEVYIFGRVGPAVQQIVVKAYWPESGLVVDWPIEVIIPNCTAAFSGRWSAADPSD